MEAPSLSRYVESGVTLLGDTRRPNGVTFAFTERTGGVSSAPYASLNLGSHCGDDPACVAENRARALAALGASAIADRLVEPRQVHGDEVVVVDSASPAALEQARELAQAGADAIVCTAPGVPVLLCFADCVPIVLTAPGGFAVVHSGWRGTLARIGAKALSVLCERAGCVPADVTAYVGPHVSGNDYEVSPELLATWTRAPRRSPTRTVSTPIEPKEAYAVVTLPSPTSSGLHAGACLLPGLVRLLGLWVCPDPDRRGLHHGPSHSRDGRGGL